MLIGQETDVGIDHVATWMEARCKWRARMKDEVRQGPGRREGIIHRVNGSIVMRDRFGDQDIGVESGIGHACLTLHASGSVSNIMNVGASFITIVKRRESKTRWR